MEHPDRLDQSNLLVVAIRRASEQSFQLASRQRVGSVPMS